MLLLSHFKSYFLWSIWGVLDVITHYVGSTVEMFVQTFNVSLLVILRVFATRYGSSVEVEWKVKLPDS